MEHEATVNREFTHDLIRGAFMLLFFYRLLAGSFIAESEDGDRIISRRHRRSRRRALQRDY